MQIVCPSSNAITSGAQFFLSFCFPLSLTHSVTFYLLYIYEFVCLDADADTDVAGDVDADADAHIHAYAHTHKPYTHWSFASVTVTQLECRYYYCDASYCISVAYPSHKWWFVDDLHANKSKWHTYTHRVQLTDKICFWDGNWKVPMWPLCDTLVIFAYEMAIKMRYFGIFMCTLLCFIRKRQYESVLCMASIYLSYLCIVEKISSVFRCRSNYVTNEI